MEAVVGLIVWDSQMCSHTREVCSRGIEKAPSVDWNLDDIHRSQTKQFEDVVEPSPTCNHRRKYQSRTPNS